MKRFPLMFAVLIASLAFALATPTLDPPPGTFVGQRAEVKNPSPTAAITVSGTTLIRLNSAVDLAVGASLQLVWDGVNWVALDSRPGVGSLAYDFEALVAGQCSKSHLAAVPGALLSNACAASTNLGMDGGAVLSEVAVLTCQFTSDGVGQIQLCAHGQSDAGVLGFDLHDAGFFLRVIK